MRTHRPHHPWYLTLSYFLSVILFLSLSLSHLFSLFVSLIHCICFPDILDISICIKCLIVKFLIHLRFVAVTQLILSSSVTSSYSIPLFMHRAISVYNLPSRAQRQCGSRQLANGSPSYSTFGPWSLLSSSPTEILAGHRLILQLSRPIMSPLT